MSGRHMRRLRRGAIGLLWCAAVGLALILIAAAVLIDRARRG